MLLYIETGLFCALSRYAKTPLSRPNEPPPSSKSRLRSLIGDVKHAMAKLAAAEGRLLWIRPAKSLFAPLAQLAEQLTLKDGALGP